MNNVQEKVFELFQHFVRVCDELGLRWFLINGSALGAVKYHGFIPWDDDLDVGMPREDYDLFLQKAQDMLPQNIFLQNHKTDKYFAKFYSKLRNSDTTFIESGAKHLNINHGIYMDIFPLDGATEDTDKKQKSFSNKILTWKMTCGLNDRSSMKIRIRNKIFKLFGCHKRTHLYFASFEDSVRASWADHNFVCNHGDRMSGKRILPKEYYGEGASVVFEGMEVKVPAMFDEYLTHKYGDWRADLPEDAKVSHHTTEICDTTVSYKKYIDF